MLKALSLPILLDKSKLLEERVVHLLIRMYVETLMIERLWLCSLRLAAC